MLKYDSTYGRFNGGVSVIDGDLVVNNQTIGFTAEKNPALFTWDNVGAEYVLEATGIFFTEEKHKLT